jgi:transcriptional regulator with XRE-family HTH domain
MEDRYFMNTQKAVAIRILELCNEQSISVNGLATISAVPPSTLKNIINGVSKNPGIVTIKKLCDGLNISLIDFFDTDIFRNLEQEIR